MNIMHSMCYEYMSLEIVPTHAFEMLILVIAHSSSVLVDTKYLLRAGRREVHQQETKAKIITESKN